MCRACVWLLGGPPTSTVGRWCMRPSTWESPSPKTDRLLFSVKGRITRAVLGCLVCKLPLAGGESGPRPRCEQETPPHPPLPLNKRIGSPADLGAQTRILFSQHLLTVSKCVLACVWHMYICRPTNTCAARDGCECCNVLQSHASAIPTRQQRQTRLQAPREKNPWTPGSSTAPVLLLKDRRTRRESESGAIRMQHAPMHIRHRKEHTPEERPCVALQSTAAAFVFLCLP